jgi:hypothetical protein
MKILNFPKKCKSSNLRYRRQVFPHLVKFQLLQDQILKYLLIINVKKQLKPNNFVQFQIIEIIQQVIQELEQSDLELIMAAKEQTTTKLKKCEIILY